VSVYEKDEKRYVGKILQAVRREWERDARPSARRAAAEISKHLDRPLSREMLSHYENDRYQTPLTVAKAVEKAFRARGKLTHVYYNAITEYVDSGFSADEQEFLNSLASDNVVEVTVPCSSGDWSAKGAATTQKRVTEVLASIGILIYLTRDLGHIKRASVLVFRPDTFLHEEPYLLLQSTTDPDLRAIRHMDPDNPARLIAPGRTPLSKSEWEPIGFLKAVATGVGDDLEDFVIKKRGIGPHTRV